MNESTLNTLEQEVRAEMQLSPSIPASTLKNYLKEGEHSLNQLVSDLEIDFNKDLTLRALLKNYVRYAFYGELSTFFKEYKGDIYAAQIRYC